MISGFSFFHLYEMEHFRDVHNISTLWMFYMVVSWSHFWKKNHWFHFYGKAEKYHFPYFENFMFSDSNIWVIWKVSQFLASIFISKTRLDPVFLEFRNNKLITWQVMVALCVCLALLLLTLHYNIEHEEHTKRG